MVFCLTPASLRLCARYTSFLDKDLRHHTALYEHLVVWIFHYRNTAIGAAIPSSLPEMAFLREKTRIPFRRVWYSGVLVFWAGAGKSAVHFLASGVFERKIQNTMPDTNGILRRRSQKRGLAELDRGQG
jgi:hypothetical protein